jgi:septal ring factor EnvC (AmiA/AmiB activator)
MRKQPPVHPDHAPLAIAAARRHELTRARAIQALRELDRAGAPVTFAAVAAAAAVSRSWLYTQPDISDQIRRLREKTDSAGSVGAIPADQRATSASLRARLTAALDRSKQLADENARLRRQLARALGDQRSARTRSGNDPGC